MKILMVEDSSFFGGLFRKQLAAKLSATIDLATSMQEAEELLAHHLSEYDAAILDFNLPDAPDGEIVPFVVALNLPVIVFTADLTIEVRQFVWKHKVVDYVIKSNSSSLDYLASLLVRLEKNKRVKILVVDDSSFFRKVICDLLKVHLLDVVTAKDGEEAVVAVQNDPAIRLVITDYNMPRMDGITLTETLRQRLSRDQLAIIGVSAEGDAVMAARFIKSGANDFIIKQSFLPEEFYCRVNQNLDALDHVEEIKDAAVRDHLTGLYNRRHFFNVGKKLAASAQRANLLVSCAMLDIDYFKDVNDTHGHYGGDLVLQKISDILTDEIDGHGLLARMGGEEFCVLLCDLDADEALDFFRRICVLIAGTVIVLTDKSSVQVTISIGVTTMLSGTLDEYLWAADINLYMAKENGRNQVISR